MINDRGLGASNRAWLLGVLRAVFHSFGEPEDMLGRSHTSSESRVDGTDGARCDDGRFWFLIHRRYLLHDHDSKYSSSFRQVIEARAEQRVVQEG